MAHIITAALLLCLLLWHGYGVEGLQRQKRFLLDLLHQDKPKLDTGSSVIGFCQGSCPTGWVSFNDRCFQYISVKKTWIDSELHCLSLGGNLASMHSEEEFQFIKALIKSMDAAENPAWIGTTDCHKEGTWLWSDGSKVDFTKWNMGEPNDVNGGEDCTHTSWGTQKGWNDIPCGYSYAFVCALRAVI